MAKFNLTATVNTSLAGTTLTGAEGLGTTLSGQQGFTVGVLNGVGATGPQGATDITFSLDSVEVFTTDISDVHQFVGVIDTDGFTTMSFLPYMPITGCDSCLMSLRFST